MKKVRLRESDDQPDVTQLVDSRVLASTRNLPRTVLYESMVERWMWVGLIFLGKDPSVSWKLDMWP